MFARVVRHAGRRFQRPPSAATVMAAAALFVSLSGVAYAAATVGSAEIIDNSVQSVDLKDGGAVGGVDVIDNSLTGTDVNELTLKGIAHKLIWKTSATAAAPLTSLGTVGVYTIKASCSSASGLENLSVYLRGPASEYESLATTLENNSSVATYPVSGGNTANTDFRVITFNLAGAGAWWRWSGSLFIRSATTLVQIDYHLLLDERTSPATCSFYGTGVDGA